MLRRKRKIAKRGLFGRKRRKLQSSRAVYRQTRKKFKNSHPKTKKPRKKLLLVTVTLAIFGLIYLFYYSSFFEITNITIKNANIENQEIAKQVKTSLSNLQGQNLIKLDSVEIQNRLKTEFKNFKTVEVEKDLPNSLIVTFSEYPLVANIIYESSDLRKSYVINSVGYVIKEDLENVNLPTIKIKSDEAANIEKPLIEVGKLLYILESVTYFQDKFGMNITEIQYLPIAREVHLLTEKNFFIWLDIQQGYEEQLKKLKKALVKLDIYNQELEYIDLRLAGTNGEKIIYK